MKNTWLFMLLGPLLVLLFDSKVRPTEGRIVNPASIDEFISRQMTAQRVPGLALAITQGDQIVYVKGYRTAGNGHPVTPQTQFFIASVSKSFTALAVMQLVEAGKVNLDSHIQSYLPEFTLAEPGVAAQITVRQLLNHTSGLSEVGFADMELPQPKTVEERVTSLRTAWPVAAPGTEYHYFSPNYGTLARLVEVVSGQSFSEYLDTHIFVPLEMRGSLSVVTTAEGLQRADHLAQGHLVVFGIPFQYPEVNGYMGGSGGVITTAEDMAHYLIAQNNAGRYLKHQLVRPDSLAPMHTPPKGIKSTYAMGWIETTALGQQMLEHNGIFSTYSAEALLLPESKTGIALLYNVNSFPTNTFGALQIRDGLISLLTEKQPDSAWMSVGRWGWMTGLLTLVGGFLALRSLFWLPQWAQRSSQVPLWQLLPGIIWAFAPAVLLFGLPGLTAKFADRVFGFVNFYTSMLEIFVWLGLTGVLGAINGVARIAILLRRWSGLE